MSKKKLKIKEEQVAKRFSSDILSAEYTKGMAHNQLVAITQEFLDVTQVQESKMLRDLNIHPQNMGDRKEGEWVRLDKDKHKLNIESKEAIK